MRASLSENRGSENRGLRNTAYLIVLLWGLSNARAFLVPVAIAALLAFLMAPIHRFLCKRLRVSEGLGVALSAIVLLSPLFLIGYLLARQGQGLVNDFPRILESGQSQFNQLLARPWAIKLGIGGNLQLQDLARKLSSSAGQGVVLVAGGLAALISAGSQGALILIFSILMLGSRAHLRRSTERILATSRSLSAAHVLDDVVSLIQHFLTARMLIVALIGTLSAVALSLFGLQYSVFLGALVGTLTLVPAVGFILALIPTLAVAIATGHGVGSVLGMLASLVILNLIEGNVLTPKMVGGRLNINALSSFIGLFAGGLLWGVWGMFLSVTRPDSGLREFQSKASKQKGNPCGFPFAASSVA